MGWLTNLNIAVLVCMCYLLMIYIHQFSETIVVVVENRPKPGGTDGDGSLVDAHHTEFENLVIVFSHSPPLDHRTTTIITTNVVKKAFKFFKDNPSSFFVFTSSTSTRMRTEAELMAQLAVSLGIPKANIKVDGGRGKWAVKAAALGKWVVGSDAIDHKSDHIYLVSDFEQIHWVETVLKGVVMDEYPLGNQSRHVFHAVIPLACDTDRKQVLAQMSAYLAMPEHSRNERVRERLHLLQNNIKLPS